MPIITKVAGVTYGKAQENIKTFGCKDIGSYALVRESENPYDSNAIKVSLAGLHLGYVPKRIAKELAPKMDAGRKYIAHFVGRNESPAYNIVGLTIRIEET